MSKKLGQHAIDMFIELAQSARSLEVIFTGGEPLLEFSTLKYLAHYFKKCAQKARMEIYFVIKTNGTILNQEIIEFINAYCMKLVVSIDGDSQQHDKYRRGVGGNKTHYTVSSNLKDLIKNNVMCVASITIHPSLSRNILENVRYLHNIGVDNIDIGPAYSTVFWSEINNLEFELSLYEVAQYMKESASVGKMLQVGPIYQETEHIEGKLSNCWGCGAVSTNLAFLPNGKITGCSALAMLVPKFPELIIGDVSEGLDDHMVDNLISLAQMDVNCRPSCRGCETANNCKGGCLAINYSENGVPFIHPEFYCRTISLIPKLWQIAWADNF
jgi:uncharacterized protein